MALMAAVAGKMLTKYENADNPVGEMGRAERLRYLSMEAHVFYASLEDAEAVVWRAPG